MFWQVWAPNVPGIIWFKILALMKPQTKTPVGSTQATSFVIKFTDQRGWIPKWDGTFSQCPNLKLACHHFLLFPSIQSLVLCDFEIKLKIQHRRLEWHTELFTRVFSPFFWTILCLPFVVHDVGVEEKSCHVVINHAWCHLRDIHRWHFSFSSSTWMSVLSRYRLSPSIVSQLLSVFLWQRHFQIFILNKASTMSSTAPNSCNNWFPEGALSEPGGVLFFLWCVFPLF